jgi:L,D-transpeptidase ErfK/SrfK
MGKPPLHFFQCLRVSVVIFLSLLLLEGEVFAAELIEKQIVYRVEKGDHGGIISGKLGMDWPRIARENSLNPDAPLAVGQRLKMTFRRIVPEEIEDGIIINIPDRTLYRFEKGKLKEYSFIAAGKPTWQTPLGEFVVTGKTKEPTWYVPPAIREEMEQEGRDVLVEVPPGPDNPLGKYWISLSLKGIGLHGTNAPQSIYKFRSHGCMRLRPEVAEALYHDVAVGTKGRIIYRPVKIFRATGGTIYLEVYRDVYKKGVNYSEEVKKMLQELHAEQDVDWDRIRKTIERKDGIVTDVSKRTSP